MNSEPNIASSGVTDPGYRSATPQPFYWSVWRELWENRSIYIAPILVAIVVLFGFLVSTIGLPERRRDVLLLDPAKARTAIEAPYDMAAIMLILTAFIVGLFYCLDALYGERRDRSILFWKITACIGLHHIALEGHNPAGRSAPGNVCRRSGDAVGHDALDQRATDKSWHEPCIDLDLCSAVSEFVRSSLRISRDCSLARADLWLGSIDFRLGAASNFSLGNPAVFRDRIFREDHIRHPAFRLDVERPFDGIRTDGLRF